MKHTFIAILLLALCSACTTMTTSKVSAKPSENEEYVAYLSDIEKNIAMFIIPLNYNTNGTFTDFELKASTNNFSRVTRSGDWYSEQADEEFVCLQFYSQSELAVEGKTKEESQHHHPNDAFDKMYLFACSGATASNPLDERSYTYIGDTATWSVQPISIAVLVDTSCLIRHPQDPAHPEKDWLINVNEDLIWCYTRYYQGAGNQPVREKEQDGVHNLWRPIAPIRWYKKMPKWATDQIYSNQNNDNNN